MIPARSLACRFCGAPLNPTDPDVWAEVTVWVHGPKRNGACMQGPDTGRYAHHECASLERRGIPAGQGALL